MNEQRLPEEYKGFSTAELLTLWKSIPDRTLYDTPVPREKISAMRDLLHEYAILDFVKRNDPEKIKRSKRLLAPYGIDPAPWADDNGISQEHLKDAFVELIRKEAKARKQRKKLIYQDVELRKKWLERLDD